MSKSFLVNERANDSLGKKKLNLTEVSSAFKERAGSNVESCGAVYNKVINNGHHNLLAFSNPFVEAAHIAYAEHFPLVITPDSVWQCIAQGFANHVNVNAEELRHHFVSHEDKETIKIDRDHFIKGDANNDWQGCFSEFSDKISEYIGKKRDLVVSNFSTTGPIEKAASEIILMDSMKSYFDYLVRTRCGIPKITLTGTVDDWQNICVRAAALSEFNLEWWTNSLVPVLNKIKDTFESPAVDVKFWDSFYKKQDGSGGPYVTGWINTLFPYLVDYKKNLVKNDFVNNKNSHYGPTLEDYPSSLSIAPFKWKYYNTTYEMEFLGGMVGVHQDETTLALTPNIGWAVRDYKENK